MLVTTGLMVVPASLRGYELDAGLEKESPGIGLCTMLALPELQLQLKTHDYYMGMQLFKSLRSYKYTDH
jgi:hypothetical protein